MEFQKAVQIMAENRQWKQQWLAAGEKMSDQVVCGEEHFPTQMACQHCFGAVTPHSLDLNSGH